MLKGMKEMNWNDDGANRMYIQLRNEAVVNLKDAVLFLKDNQPESARSCVIAAKEYISAMTVIADEYTK